MKRDFGQIELLEKQIRVYNKKAVSSMSFGARLKSIQMKNNLQLTFFGTSVIISLR